MPDIGHFPRDWVQKWSAGLHAPASLLETKIREALDVEFARLYTDGSVWIAPPAAEAYWASQADIDALMADLSAAKKEGTMGFKARPKPNYTHSQLGGFLPEPPKQTVNACLERWMAEQMPVSITMPHVSTFGPALLVEITALGVTVAQDGHPVFLPWSHVAIIQRTEKE